MDISSVRKVVGKIKANIFRNSNSFSVGMLKSHFRGSGLQFKEHQIYVPGDDVRFIDWKILAKTNQPFIKTFEEERNVEITVIIDATASMYSGFNGTSKLQAAIEISCLLYLLAEETSDYLQVIIIANNLITLPLLNGDKGITHLISALEKAQILDVNGKVQISTRQSFSSDKNDISKYILRHLGKSREVIFLSDFVDFINIEGLEKIIFNKRMHCFQILSPLDETAKLPFNLFAASNKQPQSGKYLKVNMIEKTKFNFLHKKIKKLRVSERYLEDFVKEML